VNSARSKPRRMLADISRSRAHYDRHNSPADYTEIRLSASLR
jgi:hypothetical protein